MQLISLKVTNFRAIERVDLQTRGKPSALVIAGPNAVGKSTVLEAVRLAKSLLSPSFHNEQELTMRDMGVLPANSIQIDEDQLYRNLAKPLHVSMRFALTDSELLFLRSRIDSWARQRIANEMAIQSDNVELALVGYLSTPDGRRAFANAMQAIDAGLKDLEKSRELRIELAMGVQEGISGANLFDQEALSVLGAKENGRRSMLNHFPADRAMPSGEASIQLGSQDAVAQMHSHSAQPAVKFTRLKTYLVNRFLEGDSARKLLTEDFRKIFDGLLSDKEMSEIKLSERGRLTVGIRDQSTGAVFDIDRMSSGEKGLILTLLMIRRGLLPGGIVLLDEPELHLNASVCRKLLPFILDDILKPAGLQAIICTHSEEILASAYSRADCNLFHMRSARDVSRIEIEDKGEVEEALRALGSSTIDVLFSTGTLYVEGADDERVLQAAFPDLVAKWKIVPLGGRQEIEKRIRQLQKSETQGLLEGLHSFLFDLDRKPTALKGSPKVRVEQWARYCLENYLIDGDAIYRVLRDVKCDAGDLGRGEMAAKLEKFAMDQIPGGAIRKAYAAIQVESPGLTNAEIDSSGGVDGVADLLSDRLSRIREALSSFDPIRWGEDFRERVAQEQALMTSDWQKSWLSKANGKILLKDLHVDLKVQMEPGEFKVRVARALAQDQGDNWAECRAVLDRLLGLGV